MSDFVHSSDSPRIFFGFPWEPSGRREALLTAAKRLSEQSAAVPEPWTDLRVAGRFLMSTVAAAIDAADVAAFDVTDLNRNVWFEVGTAIGKDKRIWLLRDSTEEAANRDWNRLRLLTTIGYSAFLNSEDVVQAFHRQRPDYAEQTLYQQVIAGSLLPVRTGTLFYVPTLYQTEAARGISRRILRESKNGITIIEDDPEETSVRALSWYAQQIYAALGTIVHLTSPRRMNSAVHNARCALIAGLAYGMGRDILMLADTDLVSSLDYRDVLYNYDSSDNATQRVGEWLEELVARHGVPEAPLSSALKKDSTLRNLRLGDPVAENEADSLPQYFIETAAFHEIFNRKAVVFVGRKGCGKTANLITASQDLNGDRRNLVVAVEPIAYELEGLVQLMRDFRAWGDQGYLSESIWKFLLLTEIAAGLSQKLLASTLPAARNTPEMDFLAFVEENPQLFATEFASRLEFAVAALRKQLIAGMTVGERRSRVSEALHQGLLQRLRQRMAPILSRYRRVAVLVDNLDKAWTREADRRQLGDFILGLLTSTDRLTDELAKADAHAGGPTVTIAVFLRSDIYHYVSESALEPDKVPVARLDWSDPQALLRVLEERYAVPRGLEDGADLWRLYFCPTVDGIPTPQFLLSRVLPKPRDLIYLCSNAITIAANRRSSRVEEPDLKSAEALYSQNATEALLVEAQAGPVEMEEVLLSFLGAPQTMAIEQVHERVRGAGVGDEHLDEVVRTLFRLSFIGLETTPGSYRFSYDFVVPGLTETMLRQLDRRVVVHPAFRAYLEIE